MAIATAIITTAAPSLTGTQSFTSAGFGTPQAVIVQASYANSTNNPQDTSAQSFGYADGTNEQYVMYSDADNKTAQNSASVGNTTACAMLGIFSANIEFEATWDSWTTDGVVLNFTNVDLTGVYLIITLIKGCTNISIGNQTIPTTGVNDITSVGFKPNLVMLQSNWYPAFGFQSNGNQTLGFAHNNSSDVVTQGCVSWCSPFAAATDDSSQWVSSTRVLDRIYQATNPIQLTAEDFDTSGFTLNSGATNPTGVYVFWLALDTGDEDGVSVDVIPSPTSTGDWAVTAPGFSPQHTMVFGTGCPSVSTIATADPLSVSYGAFNGTVEACLSSDNEADAAQMNTSSGYAAKAISAYEFNAGHNIYIEGVFKSTDASGYTLDMTTVDSTARQFLMVSLDGGGTSSVVVSGGLGRRSGSGRTGRGGSSGGSGGSSNKGKRGAGNLFGDWHE